MSTDKVGKAAEIGEDLRSLQGKILRAVWRSNLVLLGCSVCFGVSCAALSLQITADLEQEYLNQLCSVLAMANLAQMFLFNIFSIGVQFDKPLLEPRNPDGHPLASTASFVLLLLPFLLIKPLVVGSSFFAGYAPPPTFFVLIFPIFGHLVIASIRHRRYCSSVLDSLLLGIVCTSFTVSVAQDNCQIVVLFFSIASAFLSHIHFRLRRIEISSLSNNFPKSLLNSPDLSLTSILE